LIKLVLPFIPPTSNHAQKNALRGRRIIRYNTPVYNAFKARVVVELGNDNLEAFTAFLASPHKVLISIHSPRVLTKKGEVSKTFSDVDNLCKGLLDAIYKPLNANDALIMHLTASKHHADEEYTVIEWEPI
jgi:Holliday junction resolvase RusA-like endonuclease